jgi:hypothetical protein
MTPRSRSLFAAVSTTLLSLLPTAATAGGDVAGCPGEGISDLGPRKDAGFSFQHIHTIGNACKVDPGNLMPTVVLGEPALQLAGIGTAMGSQGDSFLYLYDEITGDFSAELTLQSNADNSGIMVRQDCSPRSRQAILMPSGRTGHRATHGGGDYVEKRLPGTDGSAFFSGLRIDRCGNTMVLSVFNEFGSLPGAPIGESVVVERLEWSDAPDTLLVGVAAAGFDDQVCSSYLHTIRDWRSTPGCQAGIDDLRCVGASGGGALLTWESAFEEAPIRIEVDGVLVKTVAGNATSALLAAMDFNPGRDGVSEIRVVTETHGSSTCLFCPSGEVYVNCGGEHLDDELGTGIGDGRVWLEDTLANPSPFLTSLNHQTADFGFRANTTLTAPTFIDDPIRSRLFATERWSNEDISYTFPVPTDDYEVTLLFAEGCCSDGCRDMVNPEHSPGSCRVFDILVNGEIVEDQFAQHVEASRATGRPLPNQIYGVALAMGPYVVRSANRIDIVIDDLGEGEPPEQASIKGIAIWPRATGPSGPSVEFRLQEVTGSPGAEVDVPFSIRADRPSMGFSFSVDFDEDLLEATRITQLWRRPDGTPYDFAFFEFDNDRDVPGNLGVDEGFLLGAAIVCVDACTDVLPPGQDVHVLDFGFTIRPEAIAGSTELTFQDGARGTGGSVRNKLLVDGEDITPDVATSFVFVNGRVNIVPDVVLFRRGDANGDGVLDLSDAQTTLGYLFLGWDELPCFDAADADDDGVVIMTDPVRTLMYLFLGGPPLPGPGDPGSDPTPDSLGCARGVSAR